MHAASSPLAIDSLTVSSISFVESLIVSTVMFASASVSSMRDHM